MTTRALTTSLRLSPPRRRFLRHYAEMLLVMFAGMAVLGGAAQGVFALAGGSLSDASGGVRALVMGVSMTAPMVGWMRYRGHSAARNAEMAMSMVVPTVLAAGLYWAGALPSDAVLAVQHVVMLPAMFGVMLWRYDDYASPHRSH